MFRGLQLITRKIHVQPSELYITTWDTMQSFTYLLTPWSRDLLEKLTGSAASQEIPHNAIISFSY